MNSFPCVLNVQELSVMLVSRHPTPHAKLAIASRRRRRMVGCYRMVRVGEGDVDGLMGSTIYLDYNFKIECYPIGMRHLSLGWGGSEYGGCGLGGSGKIMGLY